MSALFLPALCIAVILAGLLARTNVYDAFVRGAEEGLATLIQIAPCLCAILSATALWRETGLLTALTDGLKPVFAALRLPGEAASVVLLRPLSDGIQHNGNDLLHMGLIEGMEHDDLVDPV